MTDQIVRLELLLTYPDQYHQPIMTESSTGKYTFWTDTEKLLLHIEELNLRLDAAYTNERNLQAQVYRLESQAVGPPGFNTWMDAAMDERLRRVAAEHRIKDLEQSKSTVTPEQLATLANQVQGLAQMVARISTGEPVTE